MGCCCITELHSKEVINQKNGCRLGFVSDVEVDTCCGRVVAIIIYGKPKCFGLMGHCDDIRIPWEDIKIIGDDTILVCYNSNCGCIPKGSNCKRTNFFSDIL